MKPGTIVNISDEKSDFHYKSGEVVEVKKNRVVVMFLIRETDRVKGISCVADTFQRNQIKEIKSRNKLQLLRGL